MPHARWLRDRRCQDHQGLPAAGATCDPCRRSGLEWRQPRRGRICWRSCYRRAHRALPGQQSDLGRLSRDLDRRLSLSGRPGREDCGPTTIEALPAAPLRRPTSSSAASPRQAPRSTTRRLARFRQPLCLMTRSVHSAGHVPGRGYEFTLRLRALVCGALVSLGAIVARARRRHLTRFRPARISIQDKLAQDHRVLQERGRDRQDRRRDRADQAARQARLPRILRRAGRGEQGADHRPDHLPPVLDDQGDHLRRRDEVDRGRQDQARRSRLEIHSVLCQCEGRRREEGRRRHQVARTRAAEPADDGAWT